MSPANPSGTNTLALATSPYLRQHADNPVHWQQWTPQALAEAAARAVPILLSVGYAACHWCHVMAHESFDDDEVAAAMNAGFVCIKVDREERPDIDAVYMNATVALTGQGGWPMTCFLTPNAAFFCGTYYPKAAFLQLLSAISETWRERRAEVEQASDHIAAELRSMASGLPGGGPEVAPELCDDAVAGVLREQDTAHGGFGGAPKFPPSALLEALMRHYERTRSPAALEAVARTGNAMARGGIYDQLGGGFARYSVDGAWVVPHFEKMLYDNALLLRAYAHWARRTGDPLARRVAAQTARFLLDELGSKAPADMFTSSLDADADGREGSTYVWTPVQLTEVLGGDDGRWAAEVFGVTEAGTFEHGTSVLQLPADPDDAARLDRVRAALLVARLARAWRSTPAPVRGALVARLGELLTAHQQDLATLVTVEVGKITAEARGEVQEMIDVCQFSVGLSRQLYGRTIASERAGHRLLETWHPLGVVGVITAFNFPVAVWAWNTAVALVCGDTVVWKPSELTPLTALACQALLSRAAADVGAPAAVGGLLLGGAERGAQLVDDPRVALLSATGSVRMGQQVGPRVARRFGRVLLELGGNNAAIVAPSADLELAVRGIVFAAAGTAGQRCTSLRRLIVHRSVADDVVARVVGAYRQLAIGDPSAPDTLVGPLIHEAAYRDMVAALERARTDGGEVIGGDRREVGSPGAYYVAPAVVRMPSQTAIVATETFAPILYVLTYDDLDEAIALNNAVPQGLSSSIFTTDLREAEHFLDQSDCGIANVNIGTSGAEIGGAFGGEKQTGGGRESGSDAWKAYMRRATNTVNYSSELPLAQGVKFG